MSIAVSIVCAQRFSAQTFVVQRHEETRKFATAIVPNVDSNGKTGLLNNHNIYQK